MAFCRFVGNGHQDPLSPPSLPRTMGSPTIEEGFYFHTTEIENKNRALRVVWVG